ncbi:hypothetical protein MP228_006782 [Amoeboaphelidium protococcarum]|nr:hypothetical protein MP228_006782 [Amoeboaphelidium protococcarum]
MSESTTNIPKGITRQDVQNSLMAQNEMLKVASKYYRKVLEMSQTSLEFANSLDAVSKCKGAEQSGVGLNSAAELHRLIAKHQEQLAELIHKEYEVPLQRNLATHTKRIEENDRQFEKTMKKMQDDISKTENKMLKGRKKDLAVFQQSLKDMQRQAEELEQIREQNNTRVLQEEQRHFMFLVQKAAGVVKSEYDHYSALALLSRDVTEEIIGIAFAPPGKTLDQAEKRRVVEKFLGSSISVTGSPQLQHRDSMSSIGNTIGSGGNNYNGGFGDDAESRRVSQSSSVVGQVIHHYIKSPQGTGPAGQLPTVGGNSANSAARPATPPTTPQPLNTRRSSNSTGEKAAARRLSSGQMSPLIQDSLKKLNLAASNAGASQQQQQSSIESGQPASTQQKVARAESNSSSSVAKLTKVVEEESAAAGAGAAGFTKKSDLDLVVAIHDFAARSERELSFNKGDVLLVKQRNDNWLYATHHPAQVGAKSGWIPVSYTNSYQG